MKRFPAVVLLLIWESVAAGQPSKSFVGTVAGVNTNTAEIQVRPDQGATVLAKITKDTILQRIAPGERDLKKAEPITASNIAAGDRVLVTLDSGSVEARRIVVMSAEDINKRNLADQQDWAARGVAGVVTKKEGNDITLAIKSSGGDKPAVVSVGATTIYRRYAPDSVKFSDAQTSTLSAI